MSRVARALTTLVSIAAPIGIGIYHSAQYFGAWDNIGIRYHPAWLLVYGITFAVFAFVLGVPTLIERRNQALLGAVLASATPFALASIFIVIYDPLIPRLVVAGSAALLFLIYLIAGLLHASLSRRSDKREVVAFVISPTEWANLRDDLGRRPERKFTVGPVFDSSDPEVVASGLTVPDDVTLVVLGASALRNEQIIAVATEGHLRGIRVRSLSTFYEEWLGKIPLDELERTSLWFDIRDLHELQYIRLKRVMDLVVAGALLPVFLLSIPVVAAANLTGNRGPLFFRQDRVGQGGRIFSMWKFRTMVASDSAGGAGRWTAENDPRITRFGRVLRRTHFDELPQVINVLAGHLSIVGPRPEQEHYVRELEEKIPFYAMRHVVKPGITGWAQIKYPYGATDEDAIEKLQYELFYLKHQGPSLDTRICARTARSMLFGEGR